MKEEGAILLPLPNYIFDFLIVFVILSSLYPWISNIDSCTYLDYWMQKNSKITLLYKSNNVPLSIGGPDDFVYLWSRI